METPTMEQGPKAKGAATLSAALKKKLRSVHNVAGEREAREALGISSKALSRALAGQGVRAGTISLIEVGLAKFNDDGTAKAATAAEGAVRT